MRVPVLFVLPTHEPLRNFALYKKGAYSPSVPGPGALQYLLSVIRDKVEYPKRIQIESGSSVVALEVGPVVDQRPLDWYAKTFVVRGFIEANSPKEIPPQIDGQPIYSDPPIVKFTPAPNITSVGAPGSGTSEDVKDNLAVAGLHAAGLTGQNVAIAIVDDGFNHAFLAGKLGTVLFDSVNSWSPDPTVAPGNFKPGHGTMCAFAALLAAPQAVLLDMAFASTIPTQAGSGQSDADPTLILAMEAFDRLREYWRPDKRPPNIRALVASNSWGIANRSMDFRHGNAGRYVDNPHHLFNRHVTEMANSGIHIVFAAGNCGANFDVITCKGRQPIMGAAAMPAVLTVAGCDRTNMRVGYSSQGPGMLGMPEPREKPDVTAYTHFKGSEVHGAGTADVGTSTACPVAAGCVAALCSRDPAAGPTTPARMIKAIRDTAQLGVGQLARDNDYGCGVINPLKAARKLGLIH